jgi:hypothetical protein
VRKKVDYSGALNQVMRSSVVHARVEQTFRPSAR